MKRSHSTVLAFVLFGALTAQTAPPGTQPQHPRGPGGPGGHPTGPQGHPPAPPQHGTQPSHPGGPGGFPTGPQGHAPTPPQHGTQPPRPGGPGGLPTGPQGHRPPPPVQNYPGPRDYRPGQRPPFFQQRPDFDLRSYRRNYRSERHYRARPYVRPEGWFFRQWLFGEILPRLFWAPEYRIVDFWRYGLPVPPRGYVWVRYDRDALLVDDRTGEILQVIYGVFY